MKDLVNKVVTMCCFFLLLLTKINAQISCNDTSKTVVQVIHPCCPNSNYQNCIDLANDFFYSLPYPPVTIATVNTYQNGDTAITAYTRLSQQGCTYTFVCKEVTLVITNQIVVTRTQNASCNNNNDGQVDINLLTQGDISCIYSGTSISGYSCVITDINGNAVNSLYSQFPNVFSFSNLLPGQYTATVSGGCGSYINPMGVSFTIGSNGACGTCSFNLQAWVSKDTICEGDFGTLQSNEPGGFWTQDNSNLLWLDMYDNYMNTGLDNTAPDYNTANLYYTVTVNGETCTDTTSVVVVKKPGLPQISGPYQVCGNGNYNYRIIDVPGSQITWTNNQYGSMIRNGNILTLTTQGTASGYFTIDYSNSNAYCSNSNSLYIQVNPVAGFYVSYSTLCDNTTADIITSYPNATFSLSNPSAGYVYTFPQGNIVRVIKNNGFSGSVNLTQTVTFPGGCISTYTNAVNFYTTRHDTIRVAVCSNQLPYTWVQSHSITGQVQVINTAGTYYYSYINYTQCTNFEVLILDVVNPSSTTNQTICSNQLPYIWNGNAYSTAGTYTVHLTNAAGCDSIATLNLSILQSSGSTTNISSCSGIYWNGNYYNTSGVYIIHLTNAAGCDSTATLNLTITSLPNASITNPSNVSLGTTLNIANASTAKQIDWYLNGVKVATVHHASNITPITVAGGNGYGNASNQADYPYSVALDATENLYTVNTNFHSVEKWNTLTNTKTVVAGGNGYGNAANQLNQPRGIFVDNSNNIYVADGENHRIVKWALNGTSGTVVAGGNGAWNNADQLNYPSAVFVDAANNIYIADEFNNRIQKWAPNATSGVTVAGNFHFGSPVINNIELNHPAGVFVKPNGDIYVADMFNNRVQKFAAGSSIATTVAGQADGSAGNDACHLHFPHALYVDANDNVFVADGYNNRVQKWAPNATSGITVAGGEGNSFTNGIEALAMNTSGDMYCGSVGMQSVTKWVNPNSTINTTFTPTTTGNYYAVITFDNCCQLTTNAVDVSVFRPGTPITGNPKSCTLNTTTQLSNSNKNGVWKSNNLSVATVNQNGVVTSLSNGIANITYTYTLTGITYKSNIDFIVASVPAPASIQGLSGLCIGSSATYTSATPGGIWSTNGRLTINNNGTATANSAGTSIVTYKITNNGCSNSVSKQVVVSALPPIPSIAYAPGTNNITGSGGICKNKSFNLVGSPLNGVWSKTGVITAAPLVVNSTIVAVSTGNLAGATSITYTYTDIYGCSNARTIAANIVSCSPKGLLSATQSKSEVDFYVYPNPAKSFFKFKIDKLNPNEFVRITDMYGKQIKQVKLQLGVNSVDVSEFSKGVYFISFVGNSTRVTQKLVVE